MGIFPHKDSHSSIFTQQSVLGSTLKFAFPLVQQLASSPVQKRKAVLVGINGDYPIIPEDESEHENIERSEDVLDGEAFNTRSSRKPNAMVLKGPQNDVHRLERLLIGEWTRFCFVGYFVGAAELTKSALQKNICTKKPT